MNGKGCDTTGPDSTLKIVERHIAVSHPGRTRAVLLRGPKGAGKSALLRRVAEREAQRGGTVLTAEGHGEPDDLAVARTLLAPAGIAVPDVTGRRLDEMYPLFHKLCRQVARLGPLCLVLDDLDACDSTTVRWLDFLIRRMSGRPLVVVMSRGTAMPNDSVADLATLWCCHVVELSPLTRNDIVDLTAAELGGAPESRFADVCHRLSGGNPSHLVKLLSHLKEGGAGPDEFGLLPVGVIGRDALTAVVRERLLALPGEVRDVAVAIAVLDLTNADVVGQLACVAPRVAARVIDQLHREHLVGQGLPDPLHEWFRDCVLDVAGPARVAQLRTRAAVLLDLGGRSAEIVARQLVHLDRIDEAWMSHVLMDAAATAPEAARYLERLVEREPDNVDVRVGLATELSRSDPASASEHLMAAFRHTADPALRADLAVKFALTSRDRVEAVAARNLLAEARADLLGAGIHQSDDLHALLDASGLALDLAQSDTAAAAVARASRIAAPRGDTPAERCLLGVLAEATMRGGGPLSVALDRARRAASDDLMPTDWATLSAATVLRCAGEPAEAMAVLDRAEEAFALNGDALGRSRTLAQRAPVLMAAGEILRAEQDAVQCDWWEPPPVVLAWIAMQLGQIDRAAELLGPADLRHRVVERRDHLRTAAWIAFARDDLVTAVSQLVHCGQLVRECGPRDPSAAPLWADLAFMAHLAGRHDEALAAVNEAEDIAASWYTTETLAFAQLARGFVSTGPVAAELVGAASANFAAVPALDQQTRVEVHLGRIHLAMDDERTARAHLRIAVGLALRCGHRALAAEARGLLLGAGGRMRMPEQPDQMDLSGLTPSERRVAELAAAGASNRQIATRLFVTLRTVEVHLTRAYRKLGVARRAELQGALGLARVGVGR